MSDQQAHAWANALTPQMIDDLFGSMEAGDQAPEDVKARVQEMEKAGLIGPLEFIPDPLQPLRETNEFGVNLRVVYCFGEKYWLVDEEGFTDALGKCVGIKKNNTEGFFYADVSNLTWPMVDSEGNEVYV